jgi:protein-disulfide isomerase
MKKFFMYARFAALPLAGLLAMLAAGPARAQSGKDAKKEEGITRQQADQILDELRQIRQLLEKQSGGGNQNANAKQPVRAKLNMEGAQMLGSKDAPITIVEFTDYQCPVCEWWHANVFHELKKAYIDTGKVRFYNRDLPLDSLHPNATRAAQAGRCASDQGKFWQMREVMGSNPGKLDMNNLVADAAGLQMDVGAFRSCLDTGKYKDAVGSDVMEAMRIGADGTPSFVIGKSTADGVEGELVVGAAAFPAFDQKLKSMEAAK